jgi:hypothetical protein
VSGLGRATLSPRGERTQAVLTAMAAHWDVEFHARDSPGSPASRGAERSAGSARIRSLGRTAHEALLLDKHEPWSQRRFRPWRPVADAALLIGYPFSPVALAARQLRRGRIPYVVDMGDPWAITGPGLEQRVRQWRASRVERELWRGAAGVVLTTDLQAEELTAHFPTLNVLVQPNGYTPVDALTPSRRAGSDEFRIVHFGNLYEARLDLAPFFASMVRHAAPKPVTFTNFGQDWQSASSGWSRGVQVKSEPPVPWETAIRRANEFDIALVVGNRSPVQLPSKVVQYATLPIPRVAVTNGIPGDALSTYARRRRGWCVVAADEPRAGAAILAHANRDWTSRALMPDVSDAWPAVADRIVHFFAQSVRMPLASHDAPSRT